jgi:hypothetical protein
VFHLKKGFEIMSFGIGFFELIIIGAVLALIVAVVVGVVIATNSGSKRE